MPKARLVEITDPKHGETMAEILSGGGIVGAIWSHHLYFLACNAYDVGAVKKLNKLKKRPESQVLASPGAVEEAEEFADFKKSTALLKTAKLMGMPPKKYLEFLYKKFPLAVELVANSNAPSSITFATKNGKTIWIAGHMRDKTYSKLLAVVRALRRSGKKIVFAGTSLNLAGNNTLTVRELEKVLEDFSDKIDAISVYPKAEKLKRLNFTTSCSVVSFIGANPELLRIGSTSVATLKKIIPGLTIPQVIRSTRKS